MKLGRVIIDDLIGPLNGSNSDPITEPAQCFSIVQRLFKEVSGFAFHKNLMVGHQKFA